MPVLLSYSYRNLRGRRATTLLTACGMGLVIFVFTAVLMLSEGIERTLAATGNPENVVFVRRSAETEVMSIIERDQAAILETLPGIATDAQGRPLAARELVVLIALVKQATGSASNVTVRGVNPRVSLLLRPQVRIVHGRMFEPGRAEVVVGKNIMERFQVGGLGDTLAFGMRRWTIVGVMDAGNTGFNSEVWGDIDLLLPAFRRTVSSSVIARMQDPPAFPRLRDLVKSDPRLPMEPWLEPAFYASQSAVMARFIRILGIVLTLIFSIGAVIGAMVTMYSAVANRVAEIGTLRALGFQRGTILWAFLAESLFLSALGGAAGLGAASLMAGMAVSTTNWQTFSELSFRLVMDGGIVAASALFAALMGLLGGILPAARAARLNIVAALRQ